MTKKFTLWAAIFLLVIIGLVPVIAMVLKSLWVEGELSLANYGVLFQSKRNWLLLFNSFTLAGATTLVTVIVGVPLGILLGKTDLPLKRTFAVLFLIPLIIPPYILAIAWFFLLGRSGVTARLLGQEVSAITSNLLFGFPGSFFIMVSALLPVVLVLTMVFLRMVNPQLEEAAKLSAPWQMTLRNITLPIIKPGISLAALIVFVLTLGEFGVPSSLRFEVFPVESFVQFSAFYNFNAATAAAIPLGMITLIIMIGERLFLRKKTFQLRLSKEQVIIVPLGKTKKFFLIAVSILAFVIVIVPLSVLIVKSSSLWAYYEALQRSWDSISRSLFYAATGATCLVVLGFFLGYILERKAFRLFYAADSIAVFLFALPSTVIGIGLVSLWNLEATNFIYASAVIIVLGYIAQYTALGERIMAATFSQIPHSMEEAAQIVGAGWFQRVYCILLPLTKRGLLATWVVGFILCLRDLGITMVVYPPNHDTLPVRIFTLMANSPEEIIAALCIIMIGITLLPLVLLSMITRYVRRK